MGCSGWFLVVVGSWMLHKFFVMFSHLQVVFKLISWVFDSSKLCRLVLYTHSVSHAQFLRLHYTHCLRTGYGTLPDVVTPHVAQGYDENLCVFVLRMSSISTSRLPLWCLTRPCLLRLYSFCSTWILIGCFPLQNLGASALGHRWRGVWLPGHILPPHKSWVQAVRQDD